MSLAAKAVHSADSRQKRAPAWLREPEIRVRHADVRFRALSQGEERPTGDFPHGVGNVSKCRYFLIVENQVPKFVTIGYGDEAGYKQTALELRDAAHAHDAGLVRAGALVGRAGAPVQVRNRDAKGVQTENAAFMSSPLPIAGFAVIEAVNIDEAIKMVSQVPCAVAHGVVEVWPLVGS